MATKGAPKAKAQKTSAASLASAQLADSDDDLDTGNLGHSSQPPPPRRTSRAGSARGHSPARSEGSRVSASCAVVASVGSSRKRGLNVRCACCQITAEVTLR